MAIAATTGRGRTTLLVGGCPEAAAQQAALGCVVVLVTTLDGRERHLGDRS